MSCIERRLRSWLLPLLLLSACAAPPPPKPEVPPVAPGPAAPFAHAEWADLPDWQATALRPGWPALLQSCRALRSRSGWESACNTAEQLGADADEGALHAYYATWFQPYRATQPDHGTEGLITGYYEPRLNGSRTPDERYRFPLYGLPPDMLTVDLAGLYPQLKGMRLRGRLEGKTVVPYFDRAAIMAGKAPLQGRELFWVDDEVALFFLQIQGSGRIALPDGNLVKVGYADQNGHPYVSIGKKLVEMGELTLEQASMQSIKAWGEQHPERLDALLAQNPSYVFFRELPDSLDAPLGALGVPLTPGYSVAIDPRYIPLGAPVFLSTTYPNSETPLRRLMLAQDSGGAIRGVVRADFFWGFGDEAGALAGRMKQRGALWLLLPKGMAPPLN